MLQEYAAALHGCHSRDVADINNLEVSSARPSRGLDADASAHALSARDHDGCYFHRRGSIGILMIKMATLARDDGKFASETRRWLRAILSLDTDDSEPNGTSLAHDGGHPTIRALAVMTESPIIHGDRARVVSAERALLAILKTWQARCLGRTFKLVALSKGGQDDKHADFPVHLDALMDPSAHSSLQLTNQDDGASQILVPSLSCLAAQQERVGYALVRCTAHPKTPRIRGGIGPPSTTPHNCFARILLGPVLGEVTSRSVSILVELTAAATVILSVRRPALGPRLAHKERRLRHNAGAHTPLVFAVDGLAPDCLYEYAISVSESCEQTELPGTHISDSKHASRGAPGILVRSRAHGSADADSDSDRASFDNAHAIADHKEPWGVVHDGRREGHFRTLPARPMFYVIAAVRGSLFDPGWLGDIACSGHGNFFAELVSDAATRRRPATCLDAVDISRADLGEIYPWAQVSKCARLPHKQLTLVVHFSGPWRRPDISRSRSGTLPVDLTHERGVLPQHGATVSSEEPLYDSDEAIQRFRDEYRIAWGLPYVRDLVRAVPQIWAACPPIVAFAAARTASPVN